MLSVGWTAELIPSFYSIRTFSSFIAGNTERQTSEELFMFVWIALVQGDKKETDREARLPTPTQIKRCTGHSSECALFSLLLIREKHTSCKNLNEDTWLSNGSGPSWLHAEPVPGSGMESSVRYRVVQSVYWEKSITIPWSKSRNEPADRNTSSN